MSIRGSIDSLSPTGASGWAFDANQPVRPVTLQALLDGRVIGEATAEQDRPDLLAAGLASADVLGYVEAGVAVPVRTGADILAALDRPRAEIMRRADQEAFLRAHFEPGDASGRIADDLLAWMD